MGNSDIAKYVVQYSLSTSWDISTASYDSVLNTQGIGDNPTSIYFKSDGTKMYLGSESHTDVVEYTLSTPWAISSASQTGINDIGESETEIEGLHFKSDGTKLFIVGRTTDTIYVYSLSTAWDADTISSSPIDSFDVSSQGDNPSSLRLNSDGTKMFITDGGNNSVHQYSLSTAWNVSSASYDGNFDASNQAGNVEGLFFNETDNKMYILSDGSDDKVYQYSY